MAVLKEGSKGTDVKNIQTLLNKAGAKPKLKVDGIFGPLTDTAVRAFQKKCKLKPDGKIGKKTMPVLEFGGPLPEMKVPDMLKRIAFGKIAQEHNKLMVKCYSEMEKAMAKLARVAAKETPNAKSMIVANQAIRIKIIEMEQEIADKQAEFKKLIKTAPKKAEKLAKECDSLAKKRNAYATANLTPNLKAVDASFRAVREQMDATRDIYKAKSEEIQKHFEQIMTKTNQ
jgi:Putative peptidoglycan binding domain